MILSGDERLQARQPYRLGLQVPSGLDDEVSVPGIGRRRRPPLPRVAARDSDQQGNDDLCRVNQPGSYSYADQHSAPIIGIASGAVPEGEEFAPVVVRVQGITKALLGAASMGQGLLGSFEWECDR